MVLPSIVILLKHTDSLQQSYSPSHIRDYLIRSLGPQIYEKTMVCLAVTGINLFLEMSEMPFMFDDQICRVKHLEVMSSNSDDDGTDLRQ